MGTVSLGSCGRFLVPDRMVEQALRGPGIERQVNTICGLCEGGCGVTVRLVDDLPVGLKGNSRHPLNRGGLCPVGQAGLEVLYAPNRLQGPLRRRPEGGFEATGWEEALTEIAKSLGDLQSSGNGRRAAFLHGEPGQLFDDLARRFMQALGSANVARRRGETVLPYRLAQGIDQVPGFDLANSDLVLSVGLDLFEDGAAPIHAVSAMVGSRDQANRASLIHIGSRLSPSATKAAERLAVAPGTHAAAVLGIAHVLVREGRYDRNFVAKHTFGFEDWTDDRGETRLGFRRLLLEQYYPDRAAQLSGSDPRAIIRIARRLARAERPVVICGGEATSTSNATWTTLAAHALNALLGAFDRPGGVALPSTVPLTPLPPFSAADGAPAQDGTGHSGIFAAPTDSTSFGIDPVEALAGADELDVLFLSGTNPVYDSPAGSDLKKALERIPLVVAFSSFLDETAAAADIVLPVSLFLETWQESTTPEGVAFSVLGVSQPVVSPLFDSRHPGDALLELARRAGGGLATALPWSSYEAYLKERLEGLRTSGQGSVISGSFEESWVHFLEERGWRFLESGDREAFWQGLARKGGWWNPVLARGDWNRMFRTSTGRYEFFSLELERHLEGLGRSAGESEPEPALRRGIESLGLVIEASVDEACLPHFEPPRLAGSGAAADALTLVPFRPMTGRGDIGVASPMLLEMYGYPVLSGWQTWVELAPETAHQLHLDEGDQVTLETEASPYESAFEAVVKIEPGAVAGAAHVPCGLGREGLGGAADGVGDNPVRILARDRDSVSGALATVSTRVRSTLIKKRARGGARPLVGGHG